jgi:hypothetical protein
MLEQLRRQCQEFNLINLSVILVILLIFSECPEAD